MSLKDNSKSSETQSLASGSSTSILFLHLGVTTDLVWCLLVLCKGLLDSPTGWVSHMSGLSIALWSSEGWWLCSPTQSTVHPEKGTKGSWKSFWHPPAFMNQRLFAVSSQRIAFWQLVVLNLSGDNGKEHKSDSSWNMDHKICSGDRISQGYHVYFSSLCHL
jgi:hypothetical protein